MSKVFIGSLLNSLSSGQDVDKHPFNSLFSRTTWVSRHKKGQTSLDFNETRDDRVAVALAGLYAN